LLRRNLAAPITAAPITEAGRNLIPVGLCSGPPRPLERQHHGHGGPAAIMFGCADPGERGRFSAAVLDLPVLWTKEKAVTLGHERQPFLAFTRVEHYRPPSWPEHRHPHEARNDNLPKQAQPELEVDDLDAVQTGSSPR
jgi:hypothetical protein